MEFEQDPSHAPQEEWTPLLSSRDSSSEAFDKLATCSFSDLVPDQWDAYYRRMASFVDHPRPEIRIRAIDRLSTALMRAERQHYRDQKKPFPVDLLERRLDWLLNVLVHANKKWDGVLTEFLHGLLFFDHEPFPTLLREWLHALLVETPANVSRHHIRGALVVLGEYGSTWEVASAKWLALLDDPVDYVRGCAASMLGKTCSAHTKPTPKELFELIKEKEIVRPGIASSFWSSLRFDYTGEQSEVLDWMMEILEKRSRKEPLDIPFNTLEFYLDELCEGPLVTIHEMLKRGYKKLSLNMATESQGFIKGMKDLLVLLADDADNAIAEPAAQHLARYYDVVHIPSRKI